MVGVKGTLKDDGILRADFFWDTKYVMPAYTWLKDSLFRLLNTLYSYSRRLETTCCDYRTQYVARKMQYAGLMLTIRIQPFLFKHLRQSFEDSQCWHS